MSKMELTKDIRYVGVDDREIDFFEGQYVVPEGISYNSYLILDEKIALIDTADVRMKEEWLGNIRRELDGRQPDYLIVSHMEPDHSGSIAALVAEYPGIKIVGNRWTFTFLGQFFGFDVDGRKVEVAEGDTLSLGAHTLQFFTAPMVHWPEVMVTYEQTEKVLFSADAFGRFGTPDAGGDWVGEARRYYLNIVGKYGAQVQALLKKLPALDIHAIAPLHGPVLKEDLAYYIGKYDTWSSYRPEEKGVLIAYASIYGGTAEAAGELARQLKEAGEEKVVLADLVRSDMAEVLGEAFRFDRMVLASVTYDSGLFPAMESFLARLKSKNYQKRTVALIENGTWAPMAGKHMLQALEAMKEVTVLEPVVTLRSAMKAQTVEALRKLAETLCSIR